MTRHHLKDAKLAFDNGKFVHLSTTGKQIVVPRTLVTCVVAIYHESEFYGYSGVFRTMALIKLGCVCSRLQHYVEHYILSRDVCQASQSRHVNTARQQQPLPVPDTKRHSVSIDCFSRLPPTMRGHEPIMTLVDRFPKRGMFIPCRNDMTAEDLMYVFLGEVTSPKGCPRQVMCVRDKMFQSQAWRDLALQFKIEL